MHLRAISGAHIGGREVLEAKLNGTIVWPIYSLAVQSSTVTLSAGGQDYVLRVVGVAKREGSDNPIRSRELPVSALTITRISDPSVDPYGQIINSGLTFSVPDLENNERPQAQAAYRITWIEKGVSIVVTFIQPANVRSVYANPYTVTTGFGGFTLYDANNAVSEIPIDGGTFTLMGTRVYEYHAIEYVWTSGYHEGGEVTSGLTQEVRPDANTTACSTAASVSDNDLTFDNAYFHEAAILHHITAEYDGVSGSGDISQENDYIVGTAIVIDEDSYEVSIGFVNSQNLTPTGGSCQIYARARHEERERYSWYSDAGYTYGEWYFAEDAFNVTKEEGAVTPQFTLGSFGQTPDDNGYYYATVTHTNMQTRLTDSVRFFIEISSHPETYDWTSWLQISNSPTHSHADVFIVALADNWIGYEGGDIDVNYTAVDRDTINYPSGSRVISDQPYQVNLVTDLGTLSQAAVGGTGTVTLNVPLNPNFAERTGTVEMYYNSSVEADDTFTQQESLRGYISVADAPTSTTRTTTIYNAYTLALYAEITFNIYDSNATLVHTGYWSGTVPANGSVPGPTFQGYGYGYDLDFIVTDANT